MTGRSTAGKQQFTCGLEGGARCSTGTRLLPAVVTLVAMGLHDQASRLEGPRHPPSKPPNQGGGQTALPQYEERKQLRTLYRDILEAEFAIARNDWGFNELLEDDSHSAAFLEARAEGREVDSVFSMVIKAEGGSFPGHVCYLGPKRLQKLVSLLGGDINNSTLEQLQQQCALPKPLTIVHHGQHWVPMWLKVVSDSFQSRPGLPLESYDLHLERYRPVAKTCGAHCDCTCLAAGGCVLHSLLILHGIAASLTVKKLAAAAPAAAPTPAAAPSASAASSMATPDSSYSTWTAEEQAVWHAFRKVGKGLVGQQQNRRKDRESWNCPGSLPTMASKA